MKKFTIYLKESEEIKIDVKLKDELLEMVKKSLNTSDKKTINDFVDAFKSDSEKTQIEGLIQDADVYNFYLKFMNEIDAILVEKDFFDKNPKELFGQKTASLYNYIIIGTKNAVKIVIDGIKEI